MIFSMRSYKEPVARENTCMVSFDRFFFFLEDRENHEPAASSSPKATPKPKKRTKRNKVEYNTGDRIRVVEYAKYQGRLGTVVKRTVAWVEVHLDSLQPGEKELTASFRKKDLVLLNDAGDAARQAIGGGS